MKKVAALLMCFVLFMTALPAPCVQATQQETVQQEPEVDKHQQIAKEAKRIYSRCLRATGRSSFTGVCGLMTSHQLRQMGVNKYLVVNDGNKQYDYYKDRKVTTGGYFIRALGAEAYTLEEALNEITANGTRDVYNILVGFQWTKTAAGHRYGHACVINAILDGTVYFVESYYSSLGGPEGTVLKCTIQEFAEYFDRWTRFEGIIYFGTGNYSDVCTYDNTDLFVRTRFASSLRSQPCVVGSNGCAVLRSLGAGELLRADAVFTNPDGDQYYRIQDGDRTGYIAAGAVCVQRANSESLTLSGEIILPRIREGEDMAIRGLIASTQGPVGAIEVTVTDRLGRIVLREYQSLDGDAARLELLNEDLNFDLLERGTYRLEIYADITCPVADGDGLPLHSRMCLREQTLVVGNGLFRPLQKKETKKQDGWYWSGQTWYCYCDGKPCTGWVSNNGVRYYLDAVGAVTTGWAKVDDQLRYFSPTGALCSGWLSTPEGRMYLDEEGAPLSDWQTIGEDLYCFTEEGLLVTGGISAYNGVEYTLGEDGRAAEIVEGT